MSNKSSLKYKARLLSCASFTVLIAACGGGSGGSGGGADETSATQSSQDLSMVTAATIGVSDTSLTSPTAAPVTSTYLSENATRSGNVVISTNHSDYLGKGFAAKFWNRGDGIAFTVNAIAASDYDIGVRYLNARGSDRTLSLYVNGVKQRQTVLSPLANWNTWGVKNERVTLRAGTNTIAYKFDSGDSGNVNINNIFMTQAVAQEQINVDRFSPEYIHRFRPEVMPLDCLICHAAYSMNN